MTANRDPAVWAAAQGTSFKVDDGNVPEFIPVVTNKKGPLADGKHVFLSGEDAIAKMKVGQGLKVNLFASEKEFPELAAPVQMTWDTKGRLWVAVWPSYPHWKPGDDMNDKILIFEDTDGDGVANTCKVFADKLHVPTGIELGDGGVYVAQQPNLLFLKDTNGDDVADERSVLLTGWGTGDTHAGPSNLRYGLDNWIYGSVSADDAYKGSTSGDQTEITFIEIKNILSDNSHFRGKWRTVYDGVARSNDVLRVLEAAEQVAAGLKGEVPSAAVP